MKISHRGLYALRANAASAILDHTNLRDLLERDRRLLAARARGGAEKTRR